MTEASALPAGENRRHPAALGSHLSPADGVSPSPDGVEPPSLDAMSNAFAGEPQCQQLRARQDPVLSFGQLPRAPTPRFGSCTCHSTYKCASATHSPLG